MIQRRPEFWRLSKTLREFVLTAQPDKQLNVLEQLIANPGIAEFVHDWLKLSLEQKIARVEAYLARK